MRGRQQMQRQRNAAARHARDAGKGRTIPARAARSPARPPPRNRPGRTSRSARRNASAPRPRAGAKARRAAARAAPARDRRRTSRRGASCREDKARASRARRRARRRQRSGHGSPSARRRNVTRSRHCASALVHGSRARPRPRIPRASASALSSFGGNAQVLLRRAISAPSRRRRRARSDAEARSKASSSRVSIARRRPPRSPPASAARRRGCAPTAARPTISPIARYVFARQRARAARAPRRGRWPSGTRRACRAPSRCGRERPRRAIRRRRKGKSAEGPHPADFVGHLLPQAGEGFRPLSRSRERAGVRARARGAPDCRASRRASSARCERSRRKFSSRWVRSTASPPRPRSVSTTAISAARPALAGARRVDDHAREARRQGEAGRSPCPPR